MTLFRIQSKHFMFAFLQRCNNFLKNLALIIFMMCCFVPTWVIGQEQDIKLLEEIKRAYEALNYAEAEIKATAALENYQRFTPTQLTGLHKTLGLIYYSDNREELAQRHFQSALTLNPQLQLDSLMVSPKIVKFFEAIKFERHSQANDRVDVQPQIRYILVKDKRPGAATRSLVLPGWGQHYRGSKTKGWIVTAFWGTGIVGYLTTSLARNSARDKYLAEQNPVKIESRYSTFNQLHKVRNGFFFVAASVWVYGIFDALFSGTNSHGVTPNYGFMLYPSATKGMSEIRLSIPF